MPIFEGGTREILTTAGSEVYHPLWGPLLIGDLFPKVFIGIVAASLIG